MSRAIHARWFSFFTVTRTFLAEHFPPVMHPLQTEMLRSHRGLDVNLPEFIRTRIDLLLEEWERSAEVILADATGVDRAMLRDQLVQFSLDVIHDEWPAAREQRRHGTPAVLPVPGGASTSPYSGSPTLIYRPQARPRISPRGARAPSLATRPRLRLCRPAGIAVSFNAAPRIGANRSATWSVSRTG